MTFRRCAFFSLLVILASCKPAGKQQLQIVVFGTIADIQVRHADPAQLEDVSGELQRQFQAMHRNLHAWEPGNLVDINQRFARGVPGTASQEIQQLITASQALENASEGTFNPAAGGLIGLWGFHTSDFPVTSPEPTTQQIESWVSQRPSTNDITVNGAQVASHNPAVQLDFGGIAKGFAAEAGLQTLRTAGLENALIDLGGDVLAAGSEARPWTVGIRSPDGSPLGGLKIISQEAIFTSGVSERFRSGEPRYPHIIDPRTGWPVDGLWSVTVVSKDAMKADAAATALMVAGPSHWQDIAHAMNLRQVLVIEKSGQIWVSRTLDSRMNWLDNRKEIENRQIVEIALNQ